MIRRHAAKNCVHEQSGNDARMRITSFHKTKWHQARAYYSFHSSLYFKRNLFEVNFFPVNSMAKEN